MKITIGSRITRRNHNGSSAEKLKLTAQSEAGEVPLNWFALRVQPRHEKVVAKCLTAKSFENLLPLRRGLHRWSDRRKMVELPLFPGYVFCRFNFETRLQVLQTPGVRGIVRVGNGPSPIPEEEIRAIAKVEESQVPAEPTAHFATGQRVCIAEGPLAGVEGVLQDIKSRRRLVISISLLRRSIAVELESNRVVPLPSSVGLEPAVSATHGSAEHMKGGEC